MMKQHRKGGPRGLRICLLLAVLLASWWTCAALGEERILTVNASGTRNLPLAVDPVDEDEGYSAILYDNTNGLPTSEANAIAQTSEGFIWIGSYAGLIRYDGNSFEIVASEEGILNTRCLYVDSQDRLWIGTNDFGVFLMNGPEIMRIDRDGQLASISIRAISEGMDGLTYIGSAAGVATVDAELNMTFIRDSRIMGQTIEELRQGSDGRVYGLTMNGDLFTMKDGRVVAYLNHEAWGLDSILSILPDPVHAGMLYIATENTMTNTARILYGAQEEGFGGAKSWNAEPLSYVESMEWIDGEIWICAGNGIGKLDEQGIRMLGNVPMQKQVGHVMTDYEGNLWFTSSRQCVMKIVPNQFLDLFAHCGLGDEIVNTTCMYEGKLFIGTDSGLIVLEDEKAVKHLPLTRAVTASGRDLEARDLVAFLKNVRIRSINRDSRGRLWICTWGPNGVLRYDGSEVMAFTRDDGLISIHTRTVSERADGTMMVAQPDGVSLISGDRVKACYGAEDDLTVPAILTLTEGFNQEILLGSDGGGIYVLTPEGTRHIGLKDGLKSEVILRIKRCEGREIYWIATGNSLAYMTKDYKVTTVERFPYSNNYDFYESSRGDLWILSSNGIYVVPEEQMLANGDIKPVFYGIPNGLPYIATSNSFSEQTEDGDLYIACVKGTVRVNINKPFQSISDMKVALPYADLDGQRVYPDASGTFTVPFDVQRITLYPFIFNYSLIDPMVSYRLDGFETENTRIVRSELDPVSYTNLREGTYTFLLEVDDPLAEGTVGASYRIVKQKTLSEGGAGSVILDMASLVFLLGMLIYSAMDRKRGRIDDRLFLGMILVAMTMAVMELISFLSEKSSLGFVRGVMYAQNTLYYAGLEFFPYLYLLFLEYRAHQDMNRLKKIKTWYAIPCILFLIMLLLNIRTGWIFTITKANAYRSGSIDEVVFIPVMFYFLASLPRAWKINPRAMILGIVLFGVRILWDVWYIGISSMTFIYTLFLICAHIHVITGPIEKEEDL